MGSFSSDQPFDLQFIDQTTTRHEGAVVSGANMIADSPRPELRKLGNEVVTEQTAQIRQMGTWRKQWYPKHLTPSVDASPARGRYGQHDGPTRWAA